LINIKLSEHSVFQYRKSDYSIHVWDHQDGKWDGPVIGRVGTITFCDKWQAEHMLEMLEMMLERGEWVKPEQSDSEQLCLSCLKELVDELPIKRDWLNPDLEKTIKNIIKRAERNKSKK